MEAVTLKLGSEATAELVVDTCHLASALIRDMRDDFPDVLATAQMIGLMETAASRAMHPLLKPGELSVGVVVDVAHTAPTRLGDRVIAHASFTGMEGKFYWFDVVASDSGGEIGRGRHKRAIVSKQRLVDGAKKRGV
jgi:fluoroacetyl-CoA thioesterase